MNYHKTIFISLILCCSQAFAFSCPKNMIIPEEKEYAALDVAIISGNQDLLNFLNNKFCFDHQTFYQKMEKEKRDFQGILKARDVNDFKSIFKENTPITIFSNGKFNHDLLSFYLLPYHYPHIDMKNRINAQSYLNKKINFNLKPTNKIKHKELLLYILSRYEKESYFFSDENLKFNNFHFSIIANQPIVFNKLLQFKNVNEFMFQKNSYGFMPLHYLFSPTLDYDKSDKKNHQNQMNKIIVESLTENDILKTSYNGYNFLYYAEIMKEKNLPLYHLLKSKFAYNITLKNRLTLQKEFTQNLENSLTPILNSYENEY